MNPCKVSVLWVPSLIPSISKSWYMIKIHLNWSSLPSGVILVPLWGQFLKIWICSLGSTMFRGC
jgi:hypothetical protein